MVGASLHTLSAVSEEHDRQFEFADRVECLPILDTDQAIYQHCVDNISNRLSQLPGERIVQAAAEILFGDPGAVIKVDCGEFQHSHEIAKLIGSPPGYLGHRETIPLISQEALNQYHTASLKLTFVLFDEIEKASDALWNLLLGILDKATLTLGDNRKVDFSSALI